MKQNVVLCGLRMSDIHADLMSRGLLQSVHSFRSYGATDKKKYTQTDQYRFYNQKLLFLRITPV